MAKRLPSLVGHDHELLRSLRMRTSTIVGWGSSSVRPDRRVGLHRAGVEIEHADLLFERRSVTGSIRAPVTTITTAFGLGLSLQFAADPVVAMVIVEQRVCEGKPPVLQRPAMKLPSYPGGNAQSETPRAVGTGRPAPSRL
jgi:hypothetical protein